MHPGKGCPLSNEFCVCITDQKISQILLSHEIVFITAKNVG